MAEAQYIQQIFELTEQILRRSVDDAVAAKSIQTHLAKAQRLGLKHYESEVYNTMAVLALQQGKTEEAQLIFLKGLDLALALPTPDADLTLKFLSNLAEGYRSLWDLEAALKYAHQALEINDQHHLRALATLYIYAGLVTGYLDKGEFSKAERYFQKFWDVAQDATLDGYSQYEYAQIIASTQAERVKLDIVNRNEEDYQTHVSLLNAFVSQMQNQQDWGDLPHVSQLYHTVIMRGDQAEASAAAQQIEQFFKGHIPVLKLLSIANFFAHNRQPKWAAIYAQKVLDRSISESLPAGMITRAKQIVGETG